MRKQYPKAPSKLDVKDIQPAKAEGTRTIETTPMSPHPRTMSDDSLNLSVERPKPSEEVLQPLKLVKRNPGMSKSIVNSSITSQRLNKNSQRSTMQTRLQSPNPESTFYSATPKVPDYRACT